MIPSAIWNELATHALAAREQAYAPYSSFAVGAALLTDSGQIVAGCNVENISFPCGQCAESSAVGTLICKYGPVLIRAVVVAGSARQFTWPCGRCRQVLAEFARADTSVMAIAGTRRSEPVALATLLPHAFAALE